MLSPSAGADLREKSLIDVDEAQLIVGINTGNKSFLLWFIQLHKWSMILLVQASKLTECAVPIIHLTKLVVFAETFG